MNGEPPKIRVAYWLHEELQVAGTHEISKLGVVPAVGDILVDDLHPLRGPLKVRRRVFVPKPGEADIWWLVCDELPDDIELDSLIEFDAEIRAEFAILEEEARKERSEETRRKIDEMVREKRRDDR